MSTVTLTRFVIVKSTLYYDKGHVYCKEGGSVVLGEESVFSTLVKIEAERAASDNKYVNLRFCNNNKYWQKGAADNKFIVAESTKPEEDTTKPSCTLFEATKVNDNKVFYLTHVQSGGRLVIDGPTLAFYVELNPRDDESRLFYDDWETLVNLPKRVTFKGFNGSYLQGIWADGNAYLQFAADDPNAETTGYQITLLPNGLIRIYSNHFTRYWRRANNWIWASSTDASDSDNNTLFWPVKIDNNTIALRSLGNNNFCQSHNDEGKTRCLNAAVTTITNNARIVVEEQVLSRNIYNVTYRMDQARIFGETPFTAGTTTATNYSNSEAAIAVAVTYEQESTYSFNRSLSLTAGITSTITASVPLITSMSIEVSYQINTTFEWGESTTRRTSVTATGSVPVPPRSVASIRYVGTMGTCNIPYSYTQKDHSSIDGTFAETDQIDDSYNGVSCYNFTFVVDKTQPLPLSVSSDLTTPNPLLN